MEMSDEILVCFNQAIAFALDHHYEFVTPEMILLILCKNDSFLTVIEECGGNIQMLEKDLLRYIEEYVDVVQEKERTDVDLSYSTMQLMGFAAQSAHNSERGTVQLRHLVHAFFNLEESYALYFLQKQEISEIEILQLLASASDDVFL